MPAPEPARMLRLHFVESDRYGGKPLYEAVVERCRQMGVAGATVFRGLEGYGETAEIHRHQIGRHEQPIVVTIVDTAQNIQSLIPVLEGMMQTGMIAVSDVERIRLERSREL